MSGYFVQGGIQYPFGQNPQAQQQATSNQSYYGNSSYPSVQSGGQAQAPQFTMQSNNNSFQSSASGYSGNQYNVNTLSTPSNYAGNSSNKSVAAGTGSGYAGNNSSYNTQASNYTGNYGQGQNNQSSRGKSFYNVASRYSNRGRGANRGTRGGGGGRGRGGGGRGNFTSAVRGTSVVKKNTGPKPITVKEIKAYLYAWCGQRKLKPEYVVTAIESTKKFLFSCKLTVPSIDYVAEVESSNKKDAQSKAAWEFCENLVKTGHIKQSDLPPKPVQVEPTPKPASKETTQQAGSVPTESQETVDENGGWTLSNSRQRLNQFCQREHSAPIFKHTLLGPEHSRSFICELKIMVDALKKEFVATETGSNKKQSTALCALSMVRQLYKANLIEKAGETIKHVTRGGLLGAKSDVKVEKPEEGAPTPTVTPTVVGQKRKAEDQPVADQIDENGNWTPENSRQRLNKFCQTHSLPCDVIYEEEGMPGNRTYTASLSLKVKLSESEAEKELTATATGQSKKLAAQGCALQMLSQLYKLSLVEASSPTAAGPKKKQQRTSRLDPSYSGPIPLFAEFGPQYDGGRVRKTAIEDLHLNEKHKQIYPSEHELAVVQRSVRTVELALKEVADVLVDADAEAASEKNTEAEKAENKKKSKLQGLMRVGALVKGLLLKGDLNVKLVLLCKDAPTTKLLVQVAQLLPKHIKASDGDTFSVVTSMPNAAINVTNAVAKTDNEPALNCSLVITLTSPVVRSQEAVKDAPGSLNKDKCLQALAELRHAKWFQARASGLPFCVFVLRILRYMTRNMKEWKHLTDWALELIVEKAIATSPIPLSLAGSFTRVMEVIASGFLLPGGSSLMDPCEREPTDAAENLSNQDRETITRAAQESLRLMMFRQSHKVLGIEQLSSDTQKSSSQSLDQSTPMES